MNALWGLYRPHAFLGEADELLGAEALTAANGDRGMYSFAPFLVRHGKHHALFYRRVCGKSPLYLTRINVEAAGDDNVLDPVGDVKKAVVVQISEVSGVQPAVSERLRSLLGQVEIAGHEQITGHDHLARFTRR